MRIKGILIGWGSEVSESSQECSKISAEFRLKYHIRINTDVKGGRTFFPIINSRIKLEIITWILVRIKIGIIFVTDWSNRSLT